MIEVQNPVINELKQRTRKLGSQQAVANELGISPSHLSDVMSGKRNLSEEILDKLGFEKVIVHVKTNAVPDVVKAIETAQAEFEHINKLKNKVLHK